MKPIQKLPAIFYCSASGHEPVREWLKTLNTPSHVWKNGNMSKPTKANKHSGSSFDEFLIAEGIYESVQARALKRALAEQLSDAMQRGIDNGFFEKEMGHPSQCQTLHNWLYINTNL